MLIGLTTRVDQDNRYKEVRDSLDIKWYSLLKDYPITPSLFPNNLEFVQRQLNFSILMLLFLLEVVTWFLQNRNVNNLKKDSD